MKKIWLLCLLLLGSDAFGFNPVGDFDSPVYFDLQSPPAETSIPRTSKFFGSTSGGQGSLVDFEASLVFSTGEVQALNFELTRCGVDEGCTLMLDPGLLPANSQFSLVVAGPGESKEWEFSTNDVIDNEPPIVEALVVEEMGVARASVEYDDNATVLQRLVFFAASDARDDDVVIGHDFFGGQTFSILEKSRGPQADSQYVDIINEEDAFGTVCYHLTAWDRSGNQGFSEPTCIDITITDEERASLECACVLANVTGIPSAPFAIFALVFLIRRRFRDG